MKNIINAPKLFLTLVFATIFNMAMLVFRIEYSGSISHIYLIWNLFLAWMPFIVAFYLYNFKTKKIKIIWSVLLIGAWLAFFPNAPYIITDLIHLKSRPLIPLWYDAVLICGFAWTGLLLGLSSLLMIHDFIQYKSNNFVAWTFSLFAIGAGSFGIYVGRFLRWNSWDIVTRPLTVIRDILDKLVHPLSNGESLSMALVFTGFLFVSFLTLRILTEVQPENVGRGDQY